MTALDGLLAAAGAWQGQSTLQDPHNNINEDSQSRLTVSPLLAGRFIRIDYDWAYKGKPQEGMLLLGFDQEANVVTGHWIDSWHQSNKVMVLAGKPTRPTISIRGSYAAPPGPDWGWKIEITPDRDQSLRLAMFNIWPEGKEELAVAAQYERVRD